MFRASRKAGFLVTCAAFLGAVGVSSLVLRVKGIASEQSASESQTQVAKPSPPGGGRGIHREPDPVDFDDMTGWQPMFDGKTLNGWSGNPDIWKVIDGAIIGERPTPAEGRPAFRGTYLVWQGGEPADFELKLEIKLEGSGADSGIQYRAFVAPMNARPGMPPPDPSEAKWNLGGYQFDFLFGNLRTNGQIAEAAGRGSIAYRGQVVRTEAGKNPRLLSTLGDGDELGGYFKVDDWNQVHLIAHGNTLVQMINGHVMAILIDEDTTKSRSKGLIGLQYAGNPSKISFRNVRIRMIS